MMSYKFIIHESEGEIAKITFNKPDKLNVMDFPGDGGIFDEFMSALDLVNDDDDIKVVIIKGAGRSFCAGHDLSRIYFRSFENAKHLLYARGALSILVRSGLLWWFAPLYASLHRGDPCKGWEAQGAFISCGVQFTARSASYDGCAWGLKRWATGDYAV